MLMFFWVTKCIAQVNLSHLSSFAPSWINGAVNGNALNVGSSTINVSLSITNSGGVYGLTNGGTGLPTPSVLASAMTVSGSVSNMQITMDLSNNTQYTDIVYSFSAPVTNVSFRIADIDKANSFSSTYFDQVTITGTNGTSTYLPAISKLNPSSNIVVVSGNVARANSVAGSGGNSASTALDQNGTVDVNFNAVTVNSITIRYGNAAGAQANPAAQAIAIGDLTFSSTATLPVTFHSFTVMSRGNTAELNWSTTFEEDVHYYAIEKSEDGQSFSAVGRVFPDQTYTDIHQYKFSDRVVNGSDVYYRVCEVDKDAERHYSSIRKFTPVFPVSPGIIVTQNLVLLHLQKPENDLSISIFDLNGIHLKTENLRSLSSDYIISFAGKPFGLYVVRLRSARQIIFSGIFRNCR